MAGVAVVDTGPIIALVASGELRILEKLFSQVVDQRQRHRDETHEAMMAITSPRSLPKLTVRSTRCAWRFQRFLDGWGLALT